MTTIEAIDAAAELDLQPGQGCLIVLDKTGDTKTIWNRNNETEVEMARKSFDDFKKKGFTAYRVTGKDGVKGEVMREFDPDAERIIFAPRMVAG